METKEFAFDITLNAVVRITATSEVAARRIMPEVLDCLDLSSVVIDGVNGIAGVTGITAVRLTEASLVGDGGDEAHLFEVDGVAVE